MTAAQYQIPVFQQEAPLHGGGPAVILADVFDAADCQIRGVLDYSLVFSSARKDR